MSGKERHTKADIDRTAGLLVPWKALILLVACLLSHRVEAQSLDLTLQDVGLSIGDSENVTGLRLNFRDRAMQHVRGVNATVWSPYEHHGGSVDGLALGLPMTGVSALSGIGFGFIGVQADSSITGIVFGGVGAGAGQDATGVLLGGIGIGAGRDIVGIAAGGLGAGSGRDIRGISVGGLGVGAGRDAVGIIAGGLGAGAGQDMRGIVLAGMGAGAERDVVGIVVSGIGTGAGRNMTGLSLSGIATGAGGTLRGIHMAGVGIGASVVRGIILSGFAAGGHDVKALSIAPGYFKIDKGGIQQGVSVATFNRIRGEQNGLTIGIVNWARQLDGVQIGLLNGAGNKDRMRWMPFVNWN